MKLIRRGKVLLGATVFFSLSGGAPIASAHLPIIDDGTAVDAEHALFISDIALSQVAYHEVNETAQPRPSPGATTCRSNSRFPEVAGL